MDLPIVSEDLVVRARTLWLSHDADMDEVERLYRAVLNAHREGGDMKEQTLVSEHTSGIAKEKLALLLCQSGRSAEAAEMLSSLGYICRLSTTVLDYPTINSIASSTETSTTSKRPCYILDNFLTDVELQVLRDVFGDPGANYWVHHDYQIEPPSPYVSYLIPLDKTDDFGFVGELVNKCLRQLRSQFPLLDKATCVEMWAHNRPHASGHQMHFDSDNEGMGGVRNPILSTILFLTGDTGGPSLVTNQKLAHGQLATRGWISPAREKRLVAFDGKVLHGVIPGKGRPGPGRRVTLMFAFWKKIKAREGQGAAQVFDTDADWAKSLRRVVQRSENQFEPREVQPREIKPIYETLQGEAWNRDMGFPDYEKVFQGF